MDERSAWSEADKAAYRRFVRTHHPDVGGDPAEFAAGLREFRRGPGNESAARAEGPRGESVVFVRRSRGVSRLFAVLAARRRRKRNPRVR